MSQSLELSYPQAVLVTSCGAKLPLLRAFHEACQARGVRLLGADLDPFAPALSEVDEVLPLPSWRDPAWADALLAQCSAQRVGLVISTADGEWPQLLPLRSRLAEQGAALAGPQDAHGLVCCQDKRRFSQWCATQGFGVAPVLEGAERIRQFPVFVRAAFGQGGAAAWRVDYRAMLETLLELHPDAVVQPFVDAPEYSVDVLMDFQAQPVQAVVRRRLVVRGGEAWTSRVESVPQLAQEAMRLCAGLRLSGHCVVQAFWTERDGAQFIEVNPRFGGASSLSIRAGLDSPGRLLDLLAGDDDARMPRPIEIGLMLTRYGEDRFVRGTAQ